MIKKLPVRLIKYLLVGAFSFALDYLLSMLFFSVLYFTEVLSNALSVLIVSIIKFFINKRFTFKNSSKRAKAQLLVSLGVLGIYITFTSILVYLFSNVIGIPFYITKILVVFLGFFMNYSLDKNLTFGKRFD